jgi:hypothetical protein
MAKRYAVHLRKYNTDHEADGRFGGPGTSHQPTGNPRGRPATGAPATGAPSLGRTLGATGIASVAGAGAGYGGEVGGSYLGGLAGGAIGSLIGPEGTVAGAAIGSRVGQFAGSVLGGLIGDSLGTKIGGALLGIKEKSDQHAIGEGAFVGDAAAEWGAYGLSRLAPEGAAVRPLFDMLASADSHGFAGARAAQGAVSTAGALAGGLVASKLHSSKKAGKGLKKSQKAKPLFAKHFLDKPPAAYQSKGDSGGTFTAMYMSALPNLFGPKNWSSIKGTPFGGYIRSRVKAIAEKMDDAAEGQGIDLHPADPADVQLANQVNQAKQQDAIQQQQAREVQLAQLQGGQPQGGSPFGGQKSARPSPFGKAFTLPTRSPNDVVSRDAYQTGGIANAHFLQRMQESDRKSRQAQLTRALAQPKVENLAQAPGEDERMYADRMQRVMAASVENTDRLRPQLFNGGASEAGLGGLFPNKQRYKVTMKKADHEWTISTEIAKEFNTPDSLEKGLVYGWASVIEKGGQIVTDHEGDRIEIDDLTQGAHDFINKSRNGGILHDEHGHHIGHIVESMVFSHDLQKALGIDLGKVGWLVGYQIVDPRVKMLAKSGVLKAFSIGGKGKRVPVL